MIDFLLTDGLMSAHDAGHLAGAYLANPHLYARGHAHDFWNGRLLDYRDAPADVRTMMVEAMQDTIDFVRTFYGVGPLYADVLNLVGWPDGLSMPVHADSCQLDGSSNGLEHRAFSGNFYLTECDGGLQLPAQGLTILPRPGRFVSMPCGLSHPHGVMPSTDGPRITLTFFLTHDPSKADKALMAG